MEPVVNKPHWVKQEDWAKLLAESPRPLRCAVCNASPEILTVGHKVAFHDGGADTADNLLFVCRNHLVCVVPPVENVG